MSRKKGDKDYVESTGSTGCPPPLEEMTSEHALWVPGTRLAVTINPNNDKQEFDWKVRYKDRLEMFINYWLKLFKKYFQLNSSYIASVEISKYGRLHLHCFFEVFDAEEFAHSVGLIKYLGNHMINISEIKSDKQELGWYGYMIKDQTELNCRTMFDESSDVNIDIDDGVFHKDCNRVLDITKKRIAHCTPKA